MTELITVPDDTFLITTWREVRPHGKHAWGFLVHQPGDMTPKTLSDSGTLIAPGEKAVFDRSRWDGKEYVNQRIQCENVNGSILTGPPDEDLPRGVLFARNQKLWLINLGYTDQQAHNIVGAAGPGQVRSAIAWAHEALDVCMTSYLDEVDEEWEQFPERKEQHWQDAEEAACDALHVLLRSLESRIQKETRTASQIVCIMMAMRLPLPPNRDEKLMLRLFRGVRKVLAYRLPRRDDWDEIISSQIDEWDRPD